MGKATKNPTKVYSPVEVKRQGIEITFEGLTSEIKWTTFRHPDEATIPLSVLRKKSEFNRYIPAHLDELVEDYGGDEEEFVLLFCKLVDYKSIPLCSPLVSRIIIAGEIKATVSNPGGVKLWETMKAISEIAQDGGANRGCVSSIAENNP